MNVPLKKIATFGLHDCIFRGDPNVASYDWRTNHRIVSMLKGSIIDPNDTACIITTVDESKRNDVWSWMLKSLKVLNHQKPTYLMMKSAYDADNCSYASKQLASLIRSNQQCRKITCVDAEESILSAYHKVIKEHNIKFWRLYKSSNGHVEQVDSSFIDKM